MILKTVKPAKRADVLLMGVDKPLKWEYDSARGLVIETPGEWKERLPKGAHLGYGFVIPV